MQDIKRNLLIVDDDDDDILLIKECLAECLNIGDFTIDQAGNYSQAVNKFESGTYDVCLFDYRLGDQNGVELIQFVKNRYGQVPIILLTGQGDEEVAVEAMKAGAVDYLSKQRITAHSLCSSLRYAIELSNREKLRRQAEEALRQSEERFRTLFCEMNECFGLFEIVFNNEGKAIDYRFIEVNPAFERIFSVDGEDIIGKLASETNNYPEIGPVSKYYEVAFNEKSLRYPVWSNRLNKHFEHIVFSPQKGQFAIIMVDLTERKLAEEQIKYLSFHDKLTGLYNRAFVEQELIKLDCADQNPLSIIIGDINGLKMINDFLGHREGDKLLLAVANKINSCCRPGDIVARWGGDEFLIILPRTSPESAMKITRQINSACSEISIKSKGTNFAPNISMGSSTKNKIEQNINAVIKEAEDRLYRKKLLENNSFRSGIIASFLKTIGEKNYETEEHTWRMQKLAVEFGQALKLDDNQMDALVLLVTLHDIGKIAIPEQILMKPGQLSTEEWETMKRHCEIGYRITMSAPDLAHIAPAILAHHERWDGTGYPSGLKGGKIPVLSRIVSIVDAFDVMTNERPYKKAMAKKAAIQELKLCAGSQFDPSLVWVFLKLLDKMAS